MKKIPLLLLAFTLFAVPSSQAVLLVEYAFTDGQKTPTDNADNVTGDTADWSSFSAEKGVSSSSATAYVRSNGIGNTLNTGRYFSFTITADEGYTLNLDSIDFVLGGSNYSTSATYDVYASARSSLDSYSSDISINPGSVTTASYTVAVAPGSGSTTTSTSFSVDLSGSQYQGVESIGFRFYAYDQDGFSSNYYRYSSFTANGTVIPEVNAAVYLPALLVLGMLLYRRHQKR